MVERTAAFARRAAEVIAPFHDHLLGIDQGNEICCLPDSPAAPPQAVIEWCRRINEAIRSVYPDCIILSGNEQNQVLNDTGWRFGQQPGIDLYSMHGYPVPAWHSIGFDGMTDPLCQSLLPFYTQVARAFGPVMVQEFGTIVTFGARPVDYRASRAATVDAFGETWKMGVYPRDMRVELVPDGAAVLAQDQEGLPVLLSHEAGQGRVVYALPVVEAAADRQARNRWLRWYAGMVALLNG